MTCCPNLAIRKTQLKTARYFARCARTLVNENGFIICWKWCGSRVGQTSSADKFQLLSAGPTKAEGWMWWSLLQDYDVLMIAKTYRKKERKSYTVLSRHRSLPADGHVCYFTVLLVIDEWQANSMKTDYKLLLHALQFTSLSFIIINNNISTRDLQSAYYNMIIRATWNTHTKS